MSLLVVIVALLLAGALGLYFRGRARAVDRDASTAPCTSRACRPGRSAARTTGAGRRAAAHPADGYSAQARLAANCYAAGRCFRARCCWWSESGPAPKTSDGQVLLWQQAERHFPALLQQAKDPTAAPLRVDELAELRLGLRSHLQDTPNDLAGWQLLGRLGLLLNDGETAIGAWPGACSGGGRPGGGFRYASALVRAGR